MTDAASIEMSDDGCSPEGPVASLSDPTANPPVEREMVLVRFKLGEDMAWGLVDLDQWTVRHIAGGLHAWAPRIAGGEGVSVLPFTGRRFQMEDVSFVPPIENGTRIHGDLDVVWQPTLPSRPSGTEGVEPAADACLVILGAPLHGRRNPLGAVFGFVAGRAEDHPRSPDRRRLTLPPCLTLNSLRHRTNAPILTALGCGDGDCAGLARCLADQLLHADKPDHLCTGDAVVLSKPL